MAAFVALLMRRVREGRERRQEQAVIDAASPRVQSRLAAIRDPSIPPGSEPTYEPACPSPGATADPDRGRGRPRPVDESGATHRRPSPSSCASRWWWSSSRQVWACSPTRHRRSSASRQERKASAYGGATNAVPSDASAPPPTEIAASMPTDPPSPSPSLPVTGLARPIASFSCTHLGPRRVAFHDTSQTWGAPATYHWDFGGDGSSSAPDPKHRFSKPGGYDVSLIVSNSAGRSDVFTLHVHPEHGQGAIKHGRCPSGQ